MTDISPILSPARFRAWPPPTDYFRGLRAPGLCHVDNPLAFTRRNAVELSLNPRLPDYHGRWVWILAQEGTATVVADGQSHALRPGHGFLLPAQTLHYYVPGVVRRIAWLFLTFETSRAELLRPMALRLLSWNEPAAQAFRDCLAALRRQKAGETCLLLALASERMRPAATSAAVSGDWLDSALQRWVGENQDAPIGIAAFAASLGWSESHLRRVFRERKGMSLGRHMQHLRLVKACQLMNDRKRKLTDIALVCGYASPGNFSRAFRASMGLSPLEYRRRPR